jgi:biotin carboxyl carrier protein
MRFYVALGAREVLADVALLPSGRWSVVIDGARHDVDLVALDAGSRTGVSLCLMHVADRIVDLMVEPSADGAEFSAVGVRGKARIESEWARTTGSVVQRKRQEGPDVVVSPMPGRVVRLLVAPGDTVERGAPLVVIEAMKMENELRAARDGRVAAVLVRAGDTVEAGAKLVSLD